MMATHYTLRELYDICMEDDNEELLDLPLAFKFNGHYHTCEDIDKSNLVELNGTTCVLVETPYYQKYNK